MLSPPLDQSAAPAQVPDSLTMSEGRRRGVPALYLELSKARLSALVVLTAIAGFIMGSTPGTFDWARLLMTVAGTALAAAGANALNQLFEARRDALMSRTRGRPLPSGALRPAHALVFAMF